MTSKQAHNFSEDVRKELDEKSFISNIYLSIRGVGNKIFKHCTYDSLEGWLFIWTPEENFVAKESDIGDFVIVDANQTPSLI
jgi:hypothetical protein